MAFHSLQATSQALQPMQIEVSVKKPLRAGGVLPPGVGGRVASDPDQAVLIEALLLESGCVAWRGGVRWALPVSTVMPARAR